MKYDAEGNALGDVVAEGRQASQRMIGRVNDVAAQQEQAAAPPPVEEAPPQLSGEYKTVIAPDGSVKEVPVENLEKAKALGFREETAKDASVREYVEANPGLKGATKAALYEFANQASLGALDAYTSHTDDDFTRAGREELLRKNRVAQVIGGLGGAAVSLAYGGEFFDAARAAGKVAEGAVLGGELAQKALAGQIAGELTAAGAGATAAKAAAPSLARRILASGVGMGVEGAALTAPKAITEAALGDPESAAESLMYGFGAGAILGAGGAVVKGGIGKIAEHIESQGGLREMAGRKADERAFNSLASNQASLRAAAKAAVKIPGGADGVGRMLLDEGLIRGVREDVGEYAQRVAAKKSEVGQEIGALYAKADELAPGKGVNTMRLWETVQNEVIAPLEKTPGLKPLANQIRAYTEDLVSQSAEYGDTVPLAKMHEWRQSLDDTIWGTERKNLGVREEQLRSVRGVINGEMESALNDVSKDIGKDLLGEIKENNLLYRRLHAADKATSDYVLRDQANRAISASDHGVGAVAALTNPFGAIGGIGAAIGNKLLRQEGAGITARALDSFSKNGILTAEQAMGRVGAELDRIPAALQGTVDIAKRAPSRAMLELVGETEGSGSKRDQFDKVSTKITDMASNPEKMTSAISDIAGKIAGGGAPTVADAYTQKMTQVMQHLQTKLPKPLTPDSPLNSIKWKPTDRQMSEFEKRVAVVMDPFSVFDRLNDKTLTGAEVDSLKTVWPKLYDAMIGRISSYVNDPVKATPMDFTQRLKLTLLTGHDFNVNVNPNAINGLQSTYKQADQIQAPQMSKPVKTASLETDAQRIQAR